MNEPQLKRRIGPVLLTLYGIGVMVGAGIYVLVGTIAGRAGLLAPLVFVVAGCIAAPTALSYAELSVRIPRSAGEAAYIRRAFGIEWLASLTGLSIVLVGTTSAAAVLVGGVGYLGYFVNFQPWVLIIGVGVLLTLVATIGVAESLSVAAIFTITEVVGLLLVFWAGMTAPIPSPDWSAGNMLSMDSGGIGFAAIASASLLAFFAFVGFEDMVNLAEEVKHPSKTLPIGILVALAVTSILYAGVAWAAIRSVALAELAGSDQPLVLVYETSTGRPAGFLAAISVFAAFNGGLAQIIMASRVLFGLGRKNPTLRIFHQTNRVFGTPTIATLFAGVVVIVAALLFPVDRLAGLTAAILLAVFVIVNTTLIRLKRREPESPFHVHWSVPWIGAVSAFVALILALVGGLA